MALRNTSKRKKKTKQNYVESKKENPVESGGD